MSWLEHRAMDGGEGSRPAAVVSSVLRQAKRKMPQGPRVCDPSQSAGRQPLVVTPQGFRQADRIIVVLDHRAIAGPDEGIQWLDGVLLPDDSGTGKRETRRQPGRDATARRIRTGFERHDGGL